MKRKRTTATRNIDAIFARGALIDQALAEGAREALQRHKQAGLPVAVWQNGRTAWVLPEEIEVSRPIAGHRKKATG